MRVFKGNDVAHDAWQRVDAGAPLPPGGAVLVAFEDLAGALASGRGAGEIGVVLGGGDDVTGRLDELLALPLIAVDFPVFTDGRGYSVAHALRRAGFGGDLRAVGDVRRDQVFYLRRCGFTSFALGEDVDAADFRRGLADFSQVYQPAGDGRPTIAQLRSGRA